MDEEYAGGWVKLYRGIVKHWLWQEKPFSKGQAWMDLVLLAGYQPRKLRVGAHMLQLEIGELLISEASLMERWGWGKSRLRSFLALLEEDQMILRKIDHGRTVISLTGYRDYQQRQTDFEPQPDHIRTGNEPETNRYKKDKNNKNNKNFKNIPPMSPDERECHSPDKKQVAAFVRLTDEQHEELLQKYGREDLDQMICILDNYKGATGKEYRSDYHALDGWVASRLREDRQRYQQSAGKVTEVESCVLPEFLEMLKTQQGMTGFVG